MSCLEHKEVIGANAVWGASLPLGGKFERTPKKTTNNKLMTREAKRHLFSAEIWPQSTLNLGLIGFPKSLSRQNFSGMGKTSDNSRKQFSPNLTIHQQFQNLLGGGLQGYISKKRTDADTGK